MAFPPSSDFFVEIISQAFEGKVSGTHTPLLIHAHSSPDLLLLHRPNWLGIALSML